MPDLQPAQLFLFGRPAQGAPPLSEEVRNNFEAVARTFYTDNPDYPAAPRLGMTRIWRDQGPPVNVRLQWYDGATWRTIFQRLEGGVAAPLKQIVDITTPMTTWTIDHNIGSFPIVQVFDITWNQLQVTPPGPIGAGQYLLNHVNADRVVITHPGPQDGHAIVLG